MEEQTLDTQVERKVLKAGDDISNLIAGEVVRLNRTSKIPKVKLTCLVTDVDTLRINYIARLQNNKIIQGFLMHNNYRLDMTSYKLNIFSQNTGDLAQDAIYSTLDKLLIGVGL